MIYLPIAEMAVNPWLMVGLGALVGALSGLFGVGGGFLMTPLLMLVGVPAPVAVASGANLAAASAMSGVMGHVGRRAIDWRMALIILIGGVVGVTLGSFLFSFLSALGVIESVVRIAYVVLLGSLGGGLIWESGRALFLRSLGRPPPLLRRHNIAHGLPFKMRFPRSKLYISVLPPLVLGALVGVLSALMGVGGGFILIPIMVYALAMPSQVVVGSSLVQVLGLSAMTVFMQATLNNSLDIMLAGLLIVGGVVGAQFGVIVGRRLGGEQLRVLLGLLVLSVALRLALDLFNPPLDPFSIAHSAPRTLMMVLG